MHGEKDKNNISIFFAYDRYQQIYLFIQIIMNKLPDYDIEEIK
jgi:hypothetical protein